TTCLTGRLDSTPLIFFFKQKTAYEVPGELRGLNKIAVRDALEQGLVKVSRDDYKIEVEGMRYSRSRLSSALNVLGSVGYYRDGPTIGVASCINGMTESTFEFARIR